MILFGAVGAWIVGLLAVMIDMFQVKAQAAVFCGIAWQVIYARIVAQAGNGSEGWGDDRLGDAQNEKPPTTEEEEAG